MSGALEIAMIGLRAQQRALEAAAGNISNINTPAYKRVDLRFEELIGTRSAEAAPERPRPASAGVSGVMYSTVPQLDLQGQVERTENPLDLAIEGTGFIELLGPAGTILLWRGGTLRVLEDGALATQSGLVLKAGITVPDDATAMRIDRDGKVYATQAGVEGGALLGEISLARIVDPMAIERLDGGVLLVHDDSGVATGMAGESGFGTFLQATRERSNVDLNSEMVAVLIAQRAYSANAQVARAADEFYSIANGLKR